MIEKNEFFFTDDDYEVFDPELVTSTDIKINQQRNIVKNKLLKLHDLIYPTIRDHKLEIYKHYKETNITSLWYCNPRNNWKVDWLGLRYGQNPKIVKEMDKDLQSDDPDRGFLKYQCFQINIRYSGIEIGIYQNTPRNTYDASYLKEKIEDIEYQAQLISVLNDLKGLGLIWYIGQSQFNLDKEPAQNFIEFFNKHFIYGVYSCITVDIPRYSPLLLKNNIRSTCLYYIENMYKLFEIVRWKMNG